MRLLPIALVLALGASPALTAGVERARAGARSNDKGAVVDTLRFRVRAGEPLVVALPAKHEGREARYRLVRAPALSWLVDRSFLWRTLPTESGEMPVLVRREADGVEPDTLVLAVEIVGGGG